MNCVMQINKIFLQAAKTKEDNDGYKKLTGVKSNFILSVVNIFNETTLLEQNI